MRDMQDTRRIKKREGGWYEKNKRACNERRKKISDKEKVKKNEKKKFPILLMNFLSFQFSETHFFYVLISFKIHFFIFSF